MFVKLFEFEILIKKLKRFSNNAVILSDLGSFLNLTKNTKTRSFDEVISLNTLNQSQTSNNEAIFAFLF